MIATAGADLETETYELEKVNHRVDEAVAEGNRRLNAFRTFSAVHVKRIAGAVRRVRELLADLQGKECARAVVKKTVSAPCPGTRGDLGTWPDGGDFFAPPERRNPAGRRFPTFSAVGTTDLL